MVDKIKRIIAQHLVLYPSLDFGLVATEIAKLFPAWVPVTQALPDEGSEVVIRINGHYVGTAIYESVGTVCQFVNENYDGFSSDDVTDWQYVRDYSEC